MRGWRRTVFAIACSVGLVAARAAAAAEPTASLAAPASVAAGSSFQVKWTGPGAPQDFVSIDRPDANDRTYGAYAYPSSGNPLTLKAPDEAGRYVLRYHLAGDYRVIASTALEVTDVSAALEAPASSPVGTPVTVKWTGPNSPGDFIAIDRADAPERTYGPYAYTRAGSPATIAAPDQPGEYVVRYHMASTYRVIGSAPLTLTSTSAVLEAPASIPAGASLSVRWTGPDQPGDCIATGTHRPQLRLRLHSGRVACDDPRPEEPASTRALPWPRATASSGPRRSPSRTSPPRSTRRRRRRREVASR
jgi:Ca-activated chloride channel family protein